MNRFYLACPTRSTQRAQTDLFRTFSPACPARPAQPDLFSEPYKSIQSAQSERLNGPSQIRLQCSAQRAPGCRTTSPANWRIRQTWWITQTCWITQTGWVTQTCWITQIGWVRAQANELGHANRLGQDFNPICEPPKPSSYMKPSRLRIRPENHDQ